MKDSELLETLRREAEQHTPDVRGRVLAEAERFPDPIPPVKGGAVAVSAKKIWIPLVAIVLAFAVLLGGFALWRAWGSGTGGYATIVVSINPSVEFTVEEGRVKTARSLNRDAAVLLYGQDFDGVKTEEACLRFAALAEEKHLIGAEGIRVHGAGKGGAQIARRVQTALEEKYLVSEMDESVFEDLLASYDERVMGDFEDWLERELEPQKDAFKQEITALVASYEDDLNALDLNDAAAVDAFNNTYLKLGDDLTVERGTTKRELLEEFYELRQKLERSENAVLEDLFEEFLDELEDRYDREEDDDDDDDDDHDHRGDRDDDDDDDDD